MTKSLSITLCICAVSLSAALLFVCFKLSATLDTAHEALWNISAAAYNAQPTLKHVNDATGVWANASQKQADAADALIRDLRVVSWHTDRSFLKLDTMLDNYATIPAHLNKLADAGAGTAQEASKTIQTANDTIQAMQPVLADSDAILKHFDDLITSKDLSAALRHASGMTASGDVILDNAAQVSTKARQDFMKARTPWGRLVQTGWDLLDIGAMGARHIK